ncbi:hypothetical protein D3C78_1282680 [compost metagenome]
MAALAAQLFQQAYAFDSHAAVHRLAHVVDRQGGDAGGGQGLHLHPGLPGQLAAGDYVHAIVAFRIQLHLDAGEHQRMAERDEVGSLLRRLDAGDARHGEDVALGVAAGLDHGEGFRAHAHTGFGRRLTGGHRLVGDVDHVGATFGIEMGKHCKSPRAGRSGPAGDRLYTETRSGRQLPPGGREVTCGLRRTRPARSAARPAG